MGREDNEGELNDLVQQLRDLSSSYAEALSDGERLTQFVHTGVRAAGAIEKYKAIASKAIREQVTMRETYEIRIAELEAALKPFAEYTVWLDAYEYDPDDTIIGGFDVKYYLTAGDCRQARKVLGEKE